MSTSCSVGHNMKRQKLTESREFWFDSDNLLDFDNLVGVDLVGVNCVRVDLMGVDLVGDTS